MYENVFTVCNPQDEASKKKNTTKDLARVTPSIYVGETSRSIKERATEH